MHGNWDFFLWWLIDDNVFSQLSRNYFGIDIWVLVRLQSLNKNYVLNKLTLSHCYREVSFSCNDIFKNNFWLGLIIVPVNNIEITTLNLRSSHNNILTGGTPNEHAFFCTLTKTWTIWAILVWVDIPKYFETTEVRIEIMLVQNIFQKTKWGVNAAFSVDMADILNELFYIRSKGVWWSWAKTKFSSTTIRTISWK